MIAALAARGRAWSLDEYHRMRETGILTEDDRVELIDGEVVAKVVIGPHHAGVVNRLNRLLVRWSGDDFVVAVQNPRVLPHSQPEPDAMVLRWRDDLYASAHPVPADVVLLVEVADSSAALDRRRKLPLYAAGGVAEVWLVDLEATAVERHREPAAGAYTVVDVFREGTLEPTGSPSLRMSVNEILWRP